MDSLKVALLAQRIHPSFHHSGRSNSVLMVVGFDKNTVQSNDRFLVVILIDHKLDINLSHALVQSQHADLLVSQCFD